MLTVPFCVLRAAVVVPVAAAFLLARVSMAVVLLEPVGVLPVPSASVVPDVTLLLLKSPEGA